MKKIVIGIKENDTIIFLKTKEFNDTFDCQKLIKPIKIIIDIFTKREGGDISINFKKEILNENEFKQ